MTTDEHAGGPQYALCFWLDVGRIIHFFIQDYITSFETYTMPQCQEATLKKYGQINQYELLWIWKQYMFIDY